MRRAAGPTGRPTSRKRIATLRALRSILLSMRSWPPLQLPMWLQSTIDRKRGWKKAAAPRTTTRRSKFHPRLIFVTRTAARWSSSRRGKLPWKQRPRVEVEPGSARAPMGQRLSGIHTRRQRSECWLRLSRMTMETMK